MIPKGRNGLKGIAALATVMSFAGSPTRAQDFTYYVGGGGWQLERFGTNVAILRTTVSGSLPSSNRAGSLFLSCEGSERRLRLSLPERVGAAPLGSTKGQALIKPAGPGGSGQTGIQTSFLLEKERVFSFPEAGPASAGVVLPFARLLRTQPSRLDILFHFGTGPITLRSAVVYVLSLSFGGGESVLFADFLSTCDPAAPDGSR